MKDAFILYFLIFPGLILHCNTTTTSKKHAYRDLNFRANIVSTNFLIFCHYKFYLQWNKRDAGSVQDIAYCLWFLFQMPSEIIIIAARAKMNLRRAKNIFRPKNINSIVIFNVKTTFRHLQENFVVWYPWHVTSVQVSQDCSYGLDVIWMRLV